MSAPDNPKPRNSSKRPGEMDQHIGSRLRIWRRTMDIDSYALAAKIGITYQQLQKYEKGLNRISAARLYAISQVLNIPIDYFYREDAEKAASADGGDIRRQLLEQGGAEMLKYYASIRAPDVRKAVLNLMRCIAANEQSGVAAMANTGLTGETPPTSI